MILSVCSSEEDGEDEEDEEGEDEDESAEVHNVSAK